MAKKPDPDTPDLEGLTDHEISKLKRQAEIGWVGGASGVWFKYRNLVHNYQKVKQNSRSTNSKE